MAKSLESYLNEIKEKLDSSLNIRNFPCQHEERHNKPEVETRRSKELILPPILIARSKNEETLIEPSINSTRISLKVKKLDDVDKLLTGMFMRFLMLRAEQFLIMRRKAVEGYDISFLIIHSHMEQLFRERLVDFIITFLKEIEKEINEMKLSVNTRARIAANYFISNLIR
jgi:actin related protein 2/3 complex subunit 4